MPLFLALPRNAKRLCRWTNRQLLTNFLTVLFLSLTVSPVWAADISLTTSVNPPSIVNQSSEIKTTVRTPSPINNGVVDLEIFDSAGSRVFQKFFDHQYLNPNQDYSYTINWTPSSPQNYNLKIGIFDSDWSNLVHWNNNAFDLTPTKADPTGFTVSPNPAVGVANRQTTLNIAVSPQVNLDNVVFDLEIYDTNGQKSFQKFETDQTFRTGTINNYTIAWTPSASGSYTIKTGLFSQDWSVLHAWLDNAITVTVNNPAPVIEPTSTVSPSPALQPAGNYNVGGDGRIYDRSGQVVNLQGVSWFGFENNTMVLHGLWDRNWLDMIKQIKDSGFNALRVPYCPQTLRNSEIGYINTGLNPDLVGLKSLDIMDKYLAELNRQGMYFMLDLHTSDCKTITDLWTTDGYSQQQWIDDLVFLAKRYQTLDYFVGMDIKNEPKGIATWGTGDSKTDWKLAAEKAGRQILSHNPNILIFVQGVQDNPICSDNSNGHWWGGNLQPESCHPISLPANKVVFTPHVYGPDVYPQSYFDDPSFPGNLVNIWDSHFGFLQSQNKAVAIGEWGGKYGQGDARDIVWQNAFVDYLVNKGICNSFYWSWNPNSTDTGGILNDDWKTVRQDKLDLLSRYARECK